MSTPQILIVDDSIVIRKSIAKLLKPLNVDITEASNGKEGYDIVLDGGYDVILCDIDMPVMDGIELCRKLKKNNATKSIPVIIVSGFDSDEDIEKGFDAGALAYISKSDIQDILYESVEKTLSKSTFQRENIILVVDDSPHIRHIVSGGLKNAGFQVLTAENGKMALEVLNLKRPDLIISDIDMPEMNGFEFCEVIHSNSDFSAIPFVVMSSNSERGYMNRMIQHGASAYICKPFNIDQLVILVEKLLSDQYLLLLKDRERLDTERNLMVASIASLVSALEARDPYTKGHSEAVGNIVSGMLAMTGASRIEIEHAIIGGRLHDIGKIGVRDSVLLKPGLLSDIEFEHIKEHPVIGADILKAIPSLKDVLSIVKFHHERIDGNGYPAGLKGSQIPELARMSAVADTYHALTSDRPYRKALSMETALQIIYDVRNTQLCPDCIDLFIRWIQKDNFVQ